MCNFSISKLQGGDSPRKCGESRCSRGGRSSATAEPACETALASFWLTGALVTSSKAAHSIYRDHRHQVLNGTLVPVEEPSTASRTDSCHCSNVRARAANVHRGIATRTPRQGSSYGVKADFPTGGPVPRSRLFGGHCTCSMSGTHYGRGYFFDCWRPMASSAAVLPAQNQTCLMRTKSSVYAPHLSAPAVSKWI